MEHFRCTEQNLASTYNYRREIEKELLNSLPEHVLTLTNAGKVVRTVASILQLNMLECSLLVWLLKRSHYTLRDLNASANRIALFEQDQNKELLLLLLLNAYHVKSFLNHNSPPDIDAQVISLLPQFAKVYHGWRPDSLLKDASLAELNLTFNAWTLPPRKAKPDYNHLVNKVLELSKTYNVAGNDQDQPKKKRKPNEEHLEAPRKEEQSEEAAVSDREGPTFMNKSNNSMMLRSSRMQRVPFYPQIYGYQEDNHEQSLNLDSLRRSSRLKHRNIFDLQNSKIGFENSKIGAPDFSGNFFGNNTIFRTPSKDFMQNSFVSRPKIRKTSSFQQEK